MKPLIIGIAGPSSVGKTKLTKLLSKKYKAPIIHLDNYVKEKFSYEDFFKRIKNWEIPSNINFDLLYDHLSSLKEGKSIKTVEYIYEYGKIFQREKIIKPAKFVLIEGMYLFYDKRIRNLIDVKIFLTAKKMKLFERRLKREGWFGLKNFREGFLPIYFKYILPTKRFANFVIKANSNLKLILKKIEKILDRFFFEE